MAEKTKDKNPVAGVTKEELEEFVLHILKVSDIEDFCELDGDDKLKTLVRLMIDLFFRNDGTYGDVKTLEERWDIFLEGISAVTGKKLYDPYGKNKNRDVNLFSQLTGAGKAETDVFLTDGQIAERLNSSKYSEESNFSLFWDIFKNLGLEMFMVQREMLRKRGERLEPRYPGSAPEYDVSKRLTSLRILREYSDRVIRDKSEKDLTRIPDEKFERILPIFYGAHFENVFSIYIRAFPEEKLKDSDDPGHMYMDYGFIDYWWTDNCENSEEKGYFEENGVFDIRNKANEARVAQLARSFVEAFISDKRIRRKLDEAIADEERVEKEFVRLIPDKDRSTGYEVGYIVEKRKETESSVMSFKPYEKTSVIKKIFEHMDSLPIGGYLRQFLKEGGTELTCDHLFSGQFVRGANNAYIGTSGAIPTNNILGTSEMPELLKNVSRDEMQGKRFAENNPIVPLVEREHPVDWIENSEVLYTTGEYLLNQWKEQQIEGKLNSPENIKNFLYNLYVNLYKTVGEYSNSNEKLKLLDKRLAELEEKYYEEITSSEKPDLAKTEMIRRLEVYDMDSKKVKYLEKLYESSQIKDILETMKAKNKVALAIQKMSILESSLEEGAMTTPK
ncbi:MAG: hypothetical protein LBI29_04565 [Rickettsiales bacterium]|nr:hypothetical protein [Rickettsiales bacterium]